MRGLRKGEETESMIILSLFDYTGNWSKPYREAGYDVFQIDIKHGINILEWDYTSIDKTQVYGILAAVPCTDFSLSGAAWFAKKDANGQTALSIQLVKKTMEIIEYFDPTFWVIENPMSRIHKLVPELGAVKFKFHPYEFAEYDPDPRSSQYQKTTWLWGDFIEPLRKPMENIDKDKFHNGLGGKSEKTKELRSTTPLGFAYGFFESNHN
jgi:hypothetical protein